jgi:hypothetical protein
MLNLFLQEPIPPATTRNTTMKTLLAALAMVLVMGSTAMAAHRYVVAYPAPVPVVAYYAAPAPVYAAPAPVPYYAYYAPPAVAVPAPVYAYPAPVVVRAKVYPYGQPVRNVLRAVLP